MYGLERIIWQDCGVAYMEHECKSGKFTSLYSVKLILGLKVLRSLKLSPLKHFE